MLTDDSEVRGIREVLHAVSDILPKPINPPVLMSRAELWDSVEVLSRLMGEVTRRGLGSDVFDTIDLARCMTLAMFATADRDQGHSTRVPAA